MHNEILSLECFQALTDEAIQRLAQNCLNIHYLCISGCPNLTDATLLALAQYCHKLTTFEAAGCSQFTDNGFQALARVNYLFETTLIQTIQANIVIVTMILFCFQKNCHYLEKMDLEDCVLITDNTLTYLAAGCPRLEQLVSVIFSFYFLATLIT